MMQNGDVTLLKIGLTSTRYHYLSRLTARRHECGVGKENRRDHRVWVTNPGFGLDKRQCILQVTMNPLNDNIKLAVIFRGKVIRISADELAAYHQDVDIIWQSNAWADTNVCTEWVTKTLKPAVKESGEFILFCDNLVGQTSLRFQEEIRKLGGIVWYGLAGATDLWQPIDAGIGHILKVLINHEQQEWLEHDDNVERWIGNNENKLSAKERSILITKWAGDAYQKIKSS